jgi:hypothetical protein
MKCPYKYTARSRHAMAQYIMGISGYRVSRSIRECYSVAFNVKAHYVNLDPHHLWQKYAKEFISYADCAPAHVDPETYLREYKMFFLVKYNEHQDHLMNWGLEDAQSSLTVNDTYRMLWDGTEVHVNWAFAGRTGGYLCPTEIDGYTFLHRYVEDLELMLTEMPLKDLRVIYKFLVQCAEDFTQQNASTEVEYQAAFSLFCNVINPEWEHNGRQLALPEFTADWEEEMINDMRVNVS